MALEILCCVSQEVFSGQMPANSLLKLREKVLFSLVGWGNTAISRLLMETQNKVLCFTFSLHSSPHPDLQKYRDPARGVGGESSDPELGS